MPIAIHIVSSTKDGKIRVTIPDCKNPAAKPTESIVLATLDDATYKAGTLAALVTMDNPQGKNIKNALEELMTWALEVGLSEARKTNCSQSQKVIDNSSPAYPPP